MASPSSPPCAAHLPFSILPNLNQGLMDIAGIRDVVPRKNRARFVPGDGHGYVLAYARPYQIPNGAAAQIVNRKPPIAPAILDPKAQLVASRKLLRIADLRLPKKRRAYTTAMFPRRSAPSLR